MKIININVPDLVLSQPLVLSPSCILPQFLQRTLSAPLALGSLHLCLPLCYLKALGERTDSVGEMTQRNRRGTKERKTVVALVPQSLKQLTDSHSRWLTVLLDALHLMFYFYHCIN